MLFLGVSTCNGLYGSDPFNSECVEGLNAIIEKTECDLVITSSWQNEYSLEQMKEIFAWNRIVKRPMYLTGKENGALVSHATRAKEILAWLSTYTRSLGDLQWCVVDDLDLTGQIPNFVKCNSSVGLQDRKIVSKIIQMLTK